MTDFEQAVERSFERARIISNLDNIYNLKGKTIIHKENKEDNSREIVNCLQQICEYLNIYILNLFLSIVNFPSWLSF